MCCPNLAGVYPPGPASATSTAALFKEAIVNARRVWRKLDPEAGIQARASSSTMALYLAAHGRAWHSTPMSRRARQKQMHAIGHVSFSTLKARAKEFATVVALLFQGLSLGRGFPEEEQAIIKALLAFGRCLCLTAGAGKKDQSRDGTASGETKQPAKHETRRVGQLVHSADHALKPRHSLARPLAQA